jgi:hypothetical protein
MKRNAQPARPAIPIVGLLLSAVLSASPGWAQILDSTCTFCPEPVVDAIFESRVVELTWEEVPTTEGRNFTNVQTVFTADSLGLSAGFTLEGDYDGDCDLRLVIEKITQSPALDVNVRLRYSVFDQINATAGELAFATVNLYEPDTEYVMDADFVGELRISFESNVEQPTTTLGTIPVTISGLNTTLSESPRYFVTATNSVGSLSEGLQVQVSGPLPRSWSGGTLPPNALTRNLTVTTPGERFSIMDGMHVAFGEGATAPGDTVLWRAHYLFPSSGKIQADLEVFDGYRIWRSDLPDIEEFTLLGEIRPCDSRRQILLLNEDDISVDISLEYDDASRTFRITDRDLHDDFPYRYAVSTFDRGFLDNDGSVTYEGTLVMTEKLYPARSSRLRSREVIVVPNPYRKSAGWEENEPKVVFRNMPTEATIRLFSIAADHVATIRHGPGERTSTSPTSATWNLRSDAGARVASGIYIFYIEGTNRYDRDLGEGETETVTEPFQQVGKLIIVR